MDRSLFRQFMAPLNAALLVAARRVPPLWHHYQEQCRDAPMSFGSAKRCLTRARYGFYKRAAKRR